MKLGLLNKPRWMHMKRQSSWPSMRKRRDCIMSVFVSQKTQKICVSKESKLRKWNTISMSKSMKTLRISTLKSIGSTMRLKNWTKRLSH